MRHRRRLPLSLTLPTVGRGSRRSLRPTDWAARPDSSTASSTASQPPSPMSRTWPSASVQPQRFLGRGGLPRRPARAAPVVTGASAPVRVAARCAEKPGTTRQHGLHVPARTLAAHGSPATASFRRRGRRTPSSRCTAAPTCCATGTRRPGANVCAPNGSSRPAGRWRRTGSGARLAMDRVSDGAFIGWCSLTRWNPTYRSASMGYCLDDAAWGRGYATEAARACCGGHSTRWT